MRFSMTKQWSLLERFDITDGQGTLAFQARGHFGAAISLHDPAGREVAAVTKHAFTDTHEINVAGERVAQVRHTGFFGDRYEIDSTHGVLTAQGRLLTGNFTLARDGQPVAQLDRQFSLRETFAIDIADTENPAFILAVLLAIEAIHDERQSQQH
jgi:uncharacterized protein YxjI